jgi:ferritin-like metal-binding protein YciE
VDTSKLSDAVETISQEILNIKEKIKSYEADLQTAKQMGDKQEVKLLREDIRTEKNLLIELQKKENLLIANANSQGLFFKTTFSNIP